MAVFRKTEVIQVFDLLHMDWERERGPNLPDTDNHLLY